MSPPSVSASRLRAAPAPARPASGARLLDLDRAKGLAILLVVFGHLVSRQDPAGVTWYEPLRIAVYLFHMPFFMYLSGYVTYWSGAAQTPLTAWPRLVRRRAIRLLVPFFAFGVLTLAAKLIAVHVIVVDNVPPDLWDGLRALVWDTHQSPATSVWYIAVLFVYVVATPPLLRISAGSVLPLLALSALLYVLRPPPILYLDRICTYALFFTAGGFAATRGRLWLEFIDHWKWAALLCLLALVGYAASGRVHFVWTRGAEGYPYIWFFLAAGLLSMPALHGLTRMRWTAAGGVLEFLGRYVFVIYLLNTILIGVAKGILLTFLAWDARDFPGIAAGMMLAGVLGPVVVKRFIFRRMPAVDRMTD